MYPSDAISELLVPSVIIEIFREKFGPNSDRFIGPTELVVPQLTDQTYQSPSHVP